MGSKTFAQAAVLGLYTETSLHCGAESGTGYVDLPIQRERHTSYPVIQGSTIKGVLKDEIWPDLPKDERDPRIAMVFGAPDAKTPGTVAFGDGILAAFPVRSSGAPFHWVTCPFVLERVGRLFGIDGQPAKPSERGALGLRGGDVLLEEIRVEVKAQTDWFGKGTFLSRLLDLLPPAEKGFTYTREIFRERLLIVTDDDFKELVETGTEVVTRIKLNYLGTTENLKAQDHPGKSKEDLEGNLFVEELVPPETLFACGLRADPKSADALDHLPEIIRLGGDETIGRGVTHVRCIRSEGGR
jgi:CRISPR-associated protein Cmr4